ncbi:MAG: hypothetical protein ACRD0K_11295 [Egibacteraceae bacterium]
MSWERLRSQIALSEGFWLGFLFGFYRGEIEELVYEAAVTLRAGERDIDVRDLSEPEDIDVTLAWLLRERPPTTGLVWLVGTGGLGDVESWLSWWEPLLRRLNEQRETLRQALPCGLVLAGPSGLLPIARDTAPDLWSYRSMLLKPDGLLRERGSDERGEQAPRMIPMPMAPTPDPRLHARRRWPWWRRRSRRPESAPDEEVMLALPRSVDEQRAVEAVADARRAIDRYGESPDSLLRFWEDLDRLGTERAGRGDLRSALAAYAEALALARRILREGGESPKLLGNLAQSLANLGHVHERLGDLDAAYLGQVHERLGDRDAGYLGQVHERLGDLDAALSAHVEAIGLARRIAELYGETPEALRDLSDLLNAAADVHQAQGDLDAARVRRREAQEVAKRIADSTGL